MVRTAGQMRTAAGAICVLAVLSSCSPSVSVNKKDDELARLSRVGVLLFEESGTEGTRERAEIVTEVFSIQMRRYFPELVERFEIEEELMKRREACPTTLTPENARRLGQIFECDAFFTGRITQLEERSSLLGLRGGRQFGLAVTLVSARTGEVLLASTVDSEGSFLLPLDTTQEMAIYCVRKMVEEFGFDEGGPQWLNRGSPLWQAAMRAYEERRFWDAATCFGEIVSQYPVNILTEEAYLYLGRSCYELALFDTADRAWETLVSIFPKSEFRTMGMGERTALAYRQGRTADGDSLLRVLRAQRDGAEAVHLAAYSGAVAAREAGDVSRAIALFASIDDASDYGPFARFGKAECYAAQGRDDAAMGDLRFASGGAERSAGHAALAAQALIALGRKQLLLGENERALSLFDRVPAGTDAGGSAAIGKAWAHIRLGDLASAQKALAAAPRFAGLDRIEAPLLEAVTLQAEGDYTGAERALREVRLGVDWLSRGDAVASTQREIDLIAGGIRDIEATAWLTLMRRPGPERQAECGAIGDRLPLLAQNLVRARQDLELARLMEAEKPRLAALEESCELLLANVLLLQERGGVARRSAKAGGGSNAAKQEATR
jgi:tetratricopeptide (TPR) repeat protein